MNSKVHVHTSGSDTFGSDTLRVESDIKASLMGAVMASLMQPDKLIHTEQGDMTGGQFIDTLSKIDIEIYGYNIGSVDAQGNKMTGGSLTRPNADGTFTIEVGVPGVMDYIHALPSTESSQTDYVVYHEIGHVLAYSAEMAAYIPWAKSHPGEVWADGPYWEKMANTEALDISKYAGHHIETTDSYGFFHQ